MEGREYAWLCTSLLTSRTGGNILCSSFYVSNTLNVWNLIPLLNQKKGLLKSCNNMTSKKVIITNIIYVLLVLNLVSFTIIAVGYLWMFLVARTTQHAVNKDRRTSESAMAWRMTLLVATDAACWV